MTSTDAPEVPDLAPNMRQRRYPARSHGRPRASAGGPGSGGGVTQVRRQLSLPLKPVAPVTQVRRQLSFLILQTHLRHRMESKGASEGVPVSTVQKKTNTGRLWRER